MLEGFIYHMIVRKESFRNARFAQSLAIVFLHVDRDEIEFMIQHYHTTGGSFATRSPRPKT